MWLISGDFKDTIIYYYNIVIAKLIKNYFNEFLISLLTQ